jgi:hypothetical protein
MLRVWVPTAGVKMALHTRYQHRMIRWYVLHVFMSIRQHHPRR